MLASSGLVAGACPESVADARRQILRKHWSDAERALEICLAAEPEHADATYWLAHVLFQTGRYADAAVRISVYLKGAPANAQAHKVHGLSLFMVGRHQEARGALTQAVTLAPDDAEAHYYYGRVLFSTNNPSAALIEFQRVLDLDPSSVRGYNHLGQSLEALSRFEEAEAAYRKAIALEQTQQARSEWPHYNLGLLRLKNGRQREAIPHFQAAIERQPKMWEAYVQLAVSLAADGRLELAERELRTVLASAPDNADAHYQMGRLLTKMGRRDEARPHFERFGQLKATPARRN